MKCLLSRSIGFAIASAILGLCIGCSTTDGWPLGTPQSIAYNVNPAIPIAVRPPAGHVLLGHASGSGVETWSLQADPENPHRRIWVATSDEGGDLLDDTGHVIGHHSAGNSWSLNDGTNINGNIVGQVPHHNHAPWLLVRTSRSDGRGLGAARYVQQLHTVGGPHASTQGDVGTQVRAAYAADYYFYGPAAAQSHVNRGGGM